MKILNIVIVAIIYLSVSANLALASDYTYTNHEQDMILYKYA